MLSSKEDNMSEVMAQNNRCPGALKIDSLGQMLASVLWAMSVFVYGIESAGDVLQLGAALAWTVANIAAIMNSPSTGDIRY